MFKNLKIKGNLKTGEVKNGFNNFVHNSLSKMSNFGKET